MLAVVSENQRLGQQGRKRSSRVFHSKTVIVIFATIAVSRPTERANKAEELDKGLLDRLK